MASSRARTDFGGVSFIGWMLLLGAVGTGLLVRLRGLGDWPLAEDEYYLVRSVEFILQQGVPRFPVGGYYTRGLLQQYLTAPILALTSDPEWSVRIIPALCNIAAFPAVFLLGRRLGGFPVAAVATALFALSTWEVEFARFGRMYAPFQTLFLWQTWLLLRATLDRKSWAFDVMILAALVGTFVYAGAVFLWILALIPLVRGELAATAARILKTGSSMAVLLLWRLVDFRRLGTPAALPPELQSEFAGGTVLPVHLPELPLGTLLGVPGAFILWTVTAAAAASAVWRLVSSRSKPKEWLFWAFFLGLCLLHLFGLAAVLMVLAWLSMPAILRRPLQERGLRLWLLAPPLMSGLIWTLLLWNITGMDARSVVKALANYPGVIPYVLDPRVAAIPGTTILISSLLVFRALGKLRKELRVDEAEQVRGGAWSVLTTALLVSVVAVALIRTTQVTSRYSFFAYGLALILAAECTVWAISRFRLPRPATAGFLAAAFVVYFWVSEDHSVHHLSQINQPGTHYRIGKPLAVEAHLYARDDFRSPARFVNQNRESGDLVVSGVAPASYYLDRLDFTFVSSDGFRFPHVAAWGGTRDLWSGSRLLWRETSVDSLTELGFPVWLLLRGDPHGVRSEREEAWRHRLARYERFVNLDSTVHVFRLPSGGQ